MPDSAVLTFTDPDAYHASRHYAHAEGVVTTRGNFRAEFTTIRLDRLSLGRNEETLPRIVYSAIDPKMFGIVFAIYPHQQASVNGLELSQSDIIVFRAGSTGHNQTSTACQWGSIALTHGDAAAAGETIIGREVTAPPFTQRIRPPPALLSRLLNLHEAAGHLAKTAPDILAQSEVARALEQELVHAMVACIGGGEAAEMRRNSAQPRGHLTARFGSAARSIWG